MGSVVDRLAAVLEDGQEGGSARAGPVPSQAAQAGAVLVASRAKQYCKLASELLQAEQACGEAAPGASRQQAAVLLRAELALATRGCTHLACTNCSGASEAGFKGRRCGGCHLVRYCSEACRDADWDRHRRQCRRLQRELQAAAEP